MAKKMAAGNQPAAFERKINPIQKRINFMHTIHDRRGQCQAPEPRPVQAKSTEQAFEVERFGLWLSLDCQRNVLVRSAKWPSGELVARFTYEQICSLSPVDWRILSARAAKLFGKAAP
jgi:hypothetical protein